MKDRHRTAKILLENLKRRDPKPEHIRVVKRIQKPWYVEYEFLIDPPKIRRYNA